MHCDNLQYKINELVREVNKMKGKNKYEQSKRKKIKKINISS